MWKVSLHYLHNWQNYAAFSHGNLAVETLSSVSTIQDSANVVSANTFFSRNKCLECLPSPFTYSNSCQTICKTQDNFVNRTCGKFSHTFCSATFNSETVLGFRWRFQNSFMRCSLDTHLHSIQMWRVIRWLLFIFSHLLAILVEELLRDMCNARRAPCILLCPAP